MTEAKLTKKEELTLKLNLIRKERHEIQKELDRKTQDMVSLQNTIDNLHEEGITVAHHAVVRFKERIMNIPTKKINQLLRDKELEKAVKTYGDNTYRLKTVPNCLVVVKDYKVITCYSDSDIEWRIDRLEEYMKYWVNARVQQMLGKDRKIYGLTKFINKRTYIKY